jgi:MATE family multidrug resistance protein
LLDLLFVFVFNWQVQGVALATLIAEYSGLTLGLLTVFYHYKEAITKLFSHSKNFVRNLLEKHSLLGYFKLNRDILIRTLCLEICFIFITFQGARLGDEIIAANAILMNFLLLISFGLDGIANATEAMVGKSAGENNNDELHKVVNIALFWSVIFSMCYVILFFVAGEGLLRLISSIENVVMTAKIYLPWLILLPIVSCWCYLFDGVYIGLMKAKVMRNTMIISTFSCFFPVWFLFDNMLPALSGNHALWAAFSVFMLVRGLTLGWHFYVIEKN